MNPPRSSVCPTETQLEELVSGAPAGAELHEHIETCASCRAAAARIRENNAFIARHRGRLRRAVREPDARPALPADAIPGYRLVEQLHRGGQGVVYKALQESTKQWVAVKILRAGAFAGAGERVRFQREISALARLSHAGIVAIHDSGVAREQPYLVTHLVDGKPLDEWIVDSISEPVSPAEGDFGPTAAAHRNARPRPRPRAASDQAFRLFAEVCDAVHAAHMRGVIHRDLKPGNIIVDADGHPHVLDFGLAKLAAGDDSLAGSFVTRSGNFMGSLPWASPEQAGGSQGDVDVRTDVYAIGVMLFRALTGRFPYDVRGSIPEVLDRILHAEPPRPSSLRRGLNREIDTVVLKAIAKDKSRRYQSVADLRDDLSRYLRREPIAARGDSTWYVLRKTAMRHKAPLAVAVLLVVLISAFAVDRSQHARRLERALHVANVERGRSEGRAGNLALAEQLLWREHLARSRPSASSAAAERFNTPDTYWALWELYAHQPCLATWNAGDDPHSLEFAGGGRELLAMGRGAIKTWDLTADQPPKLDRVIPMAAQNRGGAYSPDKRLVAIGGMDGVISVWDIPRGQLAHRWPAHDGEIGQVVFHPDGERLVSCGEDRAVHVWRVSDQALTRTITLDAAANRLAFNPDGTLLAISLPDQDAIGLCSFPDLKSLHRLDVAESTAGHERRSKIRALLFSPDGVTLAAACYRYACVWRLGPTPELRARYWHEMEVNALAFGPNGAWLATAGTNAIRFWDMHTYKPLYTYSHTGSISDLRYDPATRLLASSGADGEIRIWESRPLAHVQSIPRRDAHCVRFSPDGTLLAHCGESPTSDGNVSVINAETGKMVASLPGQTARTSSVAFCGNSGLLAVAAYESPEVRIWRPHAAEVRSRLEAPGGVACLAVDARGECLAAGDDQKGSVTLWNLTTTAARATLDIGRARVPSMSFTPDGARLACGTYDGRVVIFDVAERRERQVLQTGRGQPIRAVSVAPDGRHLAAAGDDGVIRMWDMRSGRIVHELSGHRGAVYALSFAPSGAELASGGHDGDLRLWSAETGRNLATLATSHGVISSLSFSPDGRRLAYGAFGDTLGIVDLTHYDRHIRGNRDYQERRLRKD